MEATSLRRPARPEREDIEVHVENGTWSLVEPTARANEG